MQRLPFSHTDALVTSDPALAATFKDVEGILAPSGLDVLIEGETGTGKEGLAQAIHFHSNRRNKPFIPVNCAAIPESLAESILFGHVKGSFTGATKDQKGCFEQANGGTIFLDEVASLSRDNQARLLRVLQQREVLRVGATKLVKVDVRVVAAANVDLLAQVEAGRFRRDLYYRLAAAPITLPPLRERQGDLELLSGYFLERYRKDFGAESLCFTPEVMELFSGHSWLGNVRELENAIRYGVMLAKGRGCHQVEPQHLPSALNGNGRPVVAVVQEPRQERSGDAETRCMLAELLEKRSPRKIGELAAELGKDRSTIFKHLKRMVRDGQVEIETQRGREGSLVRLIDVP